MDQAAPAGSSSLKIFFAIVALAALFVVGGFWWVSSRSAAARDAAAEAARAGRPIAGSPALAERPEEASPSAEAPSLFPETGEVNPLDLTLEEVRSSAVPAMTRWPYGQMLQLANGSYREETTTCLSCGYRDFYVLALDTSEGGIAFGDIDGDGDDDAAVAAYEADVQVLASEAGYSGPDIDPKTEERQHAILHVILNEEGAPRSLPGALDVGHQFHIEDMRISGQEILFNVRPLESQADGSVWPDERALAYGYRLGLGGRLVATVSPFPARVATGTVAVKGDGFSFQIPNSFTPYSRGANLDEPSPDGSVNLGLSWGSEGYPNSGYTEFYTFANYDGYTAGDSGLLVRRRLPGAIQVTISGEGEQGVIQPAAPEVSVTDLAWEENLAYGKIVIANPAPRPAFTRNLVISVRTADPGAIAEAARVLIGIAESIDFDESVWW